MRLLLISLRILSAGSLRVCGKDEAGGAATSASAEAAASVTAAAAVAAAASVKASVTPRIGGNVVAVGDFSVEVALHRSGLVLALVFDQAGKVVNDGVKLSVSARAKGGATSKVELAFDAPRACFHGQAGAGVELESGPIEVSLDVAARPWAPAIWLSPWHCPNPVSAGRSSRQAILPSSSWPRARRSRPSSSTPVARPTLPAISI